VCGAGAGAGSCSGSRTRWSGRGEWAAARCSATTGLRSRRVRRVGRKTGRRIALLGRLSFTQVQRRLLFIAQWIRPAAQTYTPVVQKMGAPCRPPAPLVLLGEQAPAGVFFLNPYSLATLADQRLASPPSPSAPNLIRREPQPPDVNHTSPKLATHTRLSSRHRLEWLLLLLLLASVSWCGSRSRSTSATPSTGSRR